MVALLLGILQFVTVVGESGPSRVVRFALMTGTVLSGLAFYDFISRQLSRNRIRIINVIKKTSIALSAGIL